MVDKRHKQIWDQAKDFVHRSVGLFLDEAREHGEGSDGLVCGDHVT